MKEIKQALDPQRILNPEKPCFKVRPDDILHLFNSLFMIRKFQRKK